MFLFHEHLVNVIKTTSHTYMGKIYTCIYNHTVSVLLYFKVELKDET